MMRALFIEILLISILYTGWTRSEMKFTELTAEVPDNSIFGEWEGSVNNGTAFLTMRITQTVPDEAMIRFEVNLGGHDMPAYEGPLCSIFEDKVIGDDLIATGEPKHIFPTSCPIPTGTYKFENFVVPGEKIPPGTQGQVVAAVEIFLPDDDISLVKISALGSVELPGVNPTIPMGGGFGGK